MTVFSASAGRDLALIVVTSLAAAVIVNLPALAALVRIWVES
jgi:hypothetical protein